MGCQRDIIWVYLLVWSLILLLTGCRIDAKRNDHVYYRVGCYKEDLSNRTLPVLVAANNTNIAISNVDNCAQLSSTMGFKAFGMQNNGECWSGTQALFTYAIYGEDSNCTGGTGGEEASDIYFLAQKLTHAGCFNEDPNNRALPVFVTNTTTSGIGEIKSCARASWKKGFTKAFGLKDNGECWSGNNASHTYNKHGGARKCEGFAIDVHLFDMSVPTTTVPQVTVTMVTPTTIETSNDVDNETYYLHIGCFKEKETRAMPDLLDIWKGNNAIEKCANASWNRGFKVFGVQYSGECWSGVNASFTYAKYGNSSNCSNGMGGSWANDVYAFVLCQPGYFLNKRSNGTCQPCPVDEYQQKQNKCQKCQRNKKTWGRNGVAKADQCTDKNPINISSFEEVNIAPSDVQPGLIVANFTASYKEGSLIIPPLTYTITGVTNNSPQTRTTDVTSGDIDSCSQPDNNSSLSFCIYKHNGSIAINKNFNCSEGDRFVISIKVSDSGNDTMGTIVNPIGTVTIACVDVCKDARPLYKKASDACSKTNITVQTNETSQVVVNSTNIHAINEIHVTNMTGDNCSSFNITMTYWSINVTTWYNVRFDNIEGHTSLAHRFNNSLLVTGPVINITLLSNGCVTSASLTLVVVLKRPEECTARWSCLDAVFDWTKSSNSEKCGSDPDNMRMRYGHCVGKPTITSGPQSRNVTSGTQVTLSCVVSSSIAYNVTWYNGTNEIDTSNVTMDVYTQGYYWCQASNRYGTTRSSKALLVVNDYFTSLISFKTNKNYPKKNYPKKKNQHKDPCESCEQLSKYLSEEDKQREYNHRTVCRHWEWSKKLGVECIMYGKKNNQGEDFNNYYINLATIVTQGAKKNKIQGLKIFWKSISVKDKGICKRETTGKQNIKGLFTWESARIGETRTVECSGSSVTRSCEGNFNTGAEWNTTDYASCSYKSKKTEALHQLSKTKVDSSNAKEFAENCTKMFKSGPAADMNEADAIFAAEMVNKIISIEDQLNETASMVVEIINQVMGMNASNLKANASTMIIKSLDKVAEKIPLEEGETSRVLNSTNLVLQANDVNSSTFEGIEFDPMSKRGKLARVGGSVRLPQSIFDNSKKPSTRIGFIYFANHNLFKEEDEDDDSESENGREPSKEVLSSSVYNSNTSLLSDNVTLTFPRSKNESLTNSSCVFWDVEVRQWSNVGCFQCDGANEGSVQCCCNHLTSFAVLFSPENKPFPAEDKKHEKILSIISYVGCGISLAGVVLTFITYSLFRHLRKTNQQPILMSLCASIGLLLIVFAVGVDRTSDRLGCQIIAVLLHYLSLTTVMWMGIEAYNLYLQLVKVMAIYHHHFMRKASVVAWGVPFVIVIATVVAAVIDYNGNEDGDRVFHYGKETACILQNETYRMVSWFAPILAILLFNLVTFILVIYKLNCTGAMVPVDTKSNQKKRCWTALAIMCLLGVTWLFGALAISGARLVFEYLFCIFNSLQGFFIFFFHCIRIKEVRNQWTFFVSGLGFSHRESESYPQRSRGIGESRHSSEAPYVKVKKWIMRKDSNSEQPKCKSKVSVDDEKNVNGSICETNNIAIELDEVRNPHENDALENSDSKRRDSQSSHGSASQQ